MTPRRLRWPAVLLAGASLLGSGCAQTAEAMPRCRADQRLAIVAQSVPGAAYVPCITRLPAGWRFRSLSVHDGSTAFSLASDRAERPVQVSLTAACTVTGATPVAPRDDGVRTYERVTSIEPRYAAVVYDVFPGGCVTYEFAFERGPHIALTDELFQALALYSRRQLRTELRRTLGVTLDP